MKIVQACFRFDAPGGAEEHVLQISREMVRRGHEVAVHTSDIYTETPWKRGDWGKGARGRVHGAATGEESRERGAGKGSGAGEQGAGDEIVDGVKVVRHKAYINPVSDRWSMLVIPDMVSGLLKEECDLYHAHSHRYFQLEAAASAARSKGRPLVITPHYHPAEEKESFRTRTLLRLYDLYSGASIYRHAGMVLMMTDLEKGYMKGIVPPGKCATVGAGIDPAEWENVPSPEAFRKETGIGGRYLLYSGRLASNKGLETLFAALPSILKAFDGEMVLLGKDWGMRTRLQELARRGGFEERVRFIDFLADRKLYKSALAGCELLVLPSQWEAFGIVLLEAGMCQRPVVATAVGGVPEVVEDGRTGLLVPYGDSNTLARAVNGLLADAGQMNEMGAQARKLVLERHTWPKVVDRILKAYEEVLGKGAVS